MWHCPGASRPRKRAVALPRAFGLPALVASLTWCATSTASAAAASTSTKTIHSPAHRRLRQALRRQRRTARPLFTRPAWPRRTLRSHDYQLALPKLSLHAAALCSPCAHHVPTILPRPRTRLGVRLFKYVPHSPIKRKALHITPNPTQNRCG
jgi:hypothetical protein